MPVASRPTPLGLQTSVFTRAAEVPRFVYDALHQDEIHSNVILPSLLKCIELERNGTLIPEQLWVVCYVWNRNRAELKLIASCTNGMMGKYPAFLYSPVAYHALAGDVTIQPAVHNVVRELYSRAGTRRIYSVFGPHILSRTFANIWFDETGIQPISEPYYKSLISYCTPQTFINKPLPLPSGEFHELRLAKPADRDGIARLNLIFADDSAPFFLSQSRAYYEADELIRQGLVFVHTLGPHPEPRNIVSLVAFTRNTNKTATITKVVTDPEARGRKCAERLTRFVCNQLFTYGRKESIALFVGVENPAAKVYQRVGFVGIGANPVPADGVDEWVEYGFDRKEVDLGHW